MKLIDIVEVGRRSGLPASTLRYYEQQGLIESLGRRGLRRTFDVEVLDRLSIIALGRSAGLSLSEIRGMLGANGDLHIDRKMLEVRADEIDQTIRRMQAVRDQLRHVAKCPAPRHLECTSFNRLRKVALGRKRPKGSLKG